jgi:hypothetical protein
MVRYDNGGGGIVGLVERIIHHPAGNTDEYIDCYYWGI